MASTFVWYRNLPTLEHQDTLPMFYPYVSQRARLLLEAVQNAVLIYILELSHQVFRS